MFLPSVDYVLKMQPIGYYLGISKQTEVLMLTLIGICCTMFDASLLDLNSNLHKVWDILLDPTKVSGKTQIYLKYLLSGIILVRTFSVHLYLGFYIVMLWPAIFEERPALLLPWLMIGAIKCLAMGITSFLTGLFTCLSYGINRPACIDFVLAQIIDHTPSFYMWFCVLSYYRELKTIPINYSFESHESDFESQVTMRRRKVRSMADNVVVKHHHQMIDEDRHLISVSTIENIVQQITTDLHRKTTRSLDSLLGVMAAEAEKEEIMSTGDDVPSEEVGLTIQEKTAKLLKLTKDDIVKAQRRRRQPVFTESMLTINDNFDEAAEKPENLRRTTDSALVPAHNENTLRTTKSEKGDTRIPEYTCTNPTFMKEISETEIGSVLNYSSTTLVLILEDEAVSDLQDENKPIDIEEQDVEKSMEYSIEIQPVGLKDSNVSTSKCSKCYTCNSEIEGKKGSEKDITVSDLLVNQTPNVSSAVRSSPEKQKSDFECQASTLSRNVLKTFTPDLQQCSGNLKQILPSKKERFPRTPLTKLSENPAINNSSGYVENIVSSETPIMVATSKYVEDIAPSENPILTGTSVHAENIQGKEFKEIQEIMPAKIAPSKVVATFRMDGYTMAYKEKMMKVKNQKTTNRLFEK